MRAKYLNKSHLVLLIVLAVLAVVQPFTAGSIIPLPVPRWHIHVVNGLSNATLFVHCKSKDDDLGYHHLIGSGSEFQWTFQVNFWGTTLFWCYLHKPNANVSFEAFWIEKRRIWLKYRCSGRTCIWTAKDDGIYLRNIPDNVDELIHSWVNSG